MEKSSNLSKPDGGQDLTLDSRISNPCCHQLHSVCPLIDDPLRQEGVKRPVGNQQAASRFPWRALSGIGVTLPRVETSPFESFCIPE